MRKIIVVLVCVFSILMAGISFAAFVDNGNGSGGGGTFFDKGDLNHLNGVDLADAIRLYAA